MADTAGEQIIDGKSVPPTPPSDPGPPDSDDQSTDDKDPFAHLSSLGIDGLPDAQEDDSEEAGEDKADKSKDADAAEADKGEGEGEDADEIEGLEGDDGPDENGLVTVEYGGEEYKVPEALKSAIMKDADYTQKSQANAERVKALDEREKRIEQQAEASEEDLQDRAMLAQLNGAIEKYDAFTDEQWAELEEKDQMLAGQHHRNAERLRRRAAEIKTKISERAEESQKTQSAERSKRIEETEAFAKSKGHKPELVTKILQHAVDTGADGQAIYDQMSPATYTLLHQAYVGGQLLAKRAAPKPKTPAEPTRKVSARRRPPSSGPSDTDDMKTWVKKRAAQKRKSA